VILLFDPDEAGVKAAVKAGGLLTESGFFVKTASLGSDLDPDEFLHKYGLERFMKVLDCACDLLEFHANYPLKSFKFPLTADSKAKAAAVLLETVSRQPNPVIKQEWIKQLAERLKVSESALYAQLGAKRTDGFSARRPPMPQSAKSDVMPNIEADMLHLLLKHPELIEKAEVLVEHDFESALCWKAFSAIRKIWEKGIPGPALVSKMMAELGEDSEFISRLLVKPFESDLKGEQDAESQSHSLSQCTAGCVKRIQTLSAERRWKVLHQKKYSKLTDEEKMEHLRLTARLKS